MADNGTEFNTPVGRIVWGHPLKPQDKTDDNNQKVMKDGQVVKQWAFGVAIPKAEFIAQVWPHLAAEAAKGYQQSIPPTFSYKYKDGDDANPTWHKGKQGKPLIERPGYAGCYVLTISTELQAPATVRFENGIYREIQPDQIKTGDYVAMTLVAKWHAGQSPGLYLNPALVVQAFEGDPIETGGFSVDPTQAFGAAPQFAMPAGARPVGAGGQPQQPPMPGMQAPPTQPGAPGQPVGPAAGGYTQAPPPGSPSPAGMPGAPAQPQAGVPMQQMPPPATDFIPGQPQQPMMQPGQPQGMPGMPPPRQ